MNRIILFAIILLSTACSTNKGNTETHKKVFTFYVGTYTNGPSEGIYKYIMNNDGTLDSINLVAKTTNPSFLSISSDKKYLIAAAEVNLFEGNGAVELYKIKNDSLEFMNRNNSGGPHTCYVSVNNDNYVLAANYSGGNISLFKIEEDSILSDRLDLQQHSGSGSHNRQEAPHAHSARFVPNSNKVIGVDLGTNELWFYTLDVKSNKLHLTEQQKLVMEAEAGPRHIDFHPNGKWLYVMNELNGTVSQVAIFEDGTYSLLSTVSSLPEGFTDYNKSADIHISSDGKFLYASNRGPNSIAIFSIGDKGELSLVGFESTRGGEPRNFTLSPDENFLLVANQHSNNIISFKRNKETGTLTFIDEINAPAPVCVLFEK